MRERHPGNVPEYGAGSDGELERHKEARHADRERIIQLAADTISLAPDVMDDPESRTALRDLLHALDRRRDELEGDAAPFTLDHTDA